MENNRDAQFDFCPKCGGLARNGVCTGCGYQNPQVTARVSEPEAVEEPSSVEAAPLAEETASAETTTNPQEGRQENSYLYTAENPYAEYVNRTAYANGAIPPDVPEKKGNGKVWAIVISCVAVFVLLLVLLGCSVYSLVSKIQKLSKTETANRSENEYDFQSPGEDFGEAFGDGEEDYDDYNFEDFYKDITERAKGNQKDSDSHDSNEDMYYELGNALRDDLPYSVTFDNKKFEEEGRDVYISCYYPVLEGEIKNIDYLNQVIYDEYHYFLDYYKENVQEEMREDDMFYSIVEGYVTYMDEEKISIVFTEDACWNDYYMVSLYCVNIDVENGVVLDNTAILDIDDAFSVDFRIREEKQNGSNSLDWYTDQELTEMLNDPVNLIIFYTPLGIEVGVNHDSGWCTVTYKEYEEYLKHF